MPQRAVTLPGGPCWREGCCPTADGRLPLHGAACWAACLPGWPPPPAPEQASLADAAAACSGPHHCLDERRPILCQPAAAPRQRHLRRPAAGQGPRTVPLGGCRARWVCPGRLLCRPTWPYGVGACTSVRTAVQHESLRGLHACLVLSDSSACRSWPPRCSAAPFACAALPCLALRRLALPFAALLDACWGGPQPAMPGSDSCPGVWHLWERLQQRHCLPDDAQLENAACCVLKAVLTCQDAAQLARSYATALAAAAGGLSCLHAAAPSCSAPQAVTLKATQATRATFVSGRAAGCRARCPLARLRRCLLPRPQHRPVLAVSVPQKRLVPSRAALQKRFYCLQFS